MDFVCLKLSSGEEIFTALTEFRDPLKRTIEVMYPMELKRDVQIDERGEVQKIVKLAPYFPFATDRVFRLNTTHILHINPLAENLIKTYKDCVDAYSQAEDGQGVPAPAPVNSNQVVDINVDEPEDTTDTFYVQGNDTIN